MKGLAGSQAKLHLEISQLNLNIYLSYIYFMGINLSGAFPIYILFLAT